MSTFYLQENLYSDVPITENESSLPDPNDNPALNPQNSLAGWLQIMPEIMLDLRDKIMDEIHFMEQFFIRLQNIYAFVCQMSFFILCQSILEANLFEPKNDRIVVAALSTILFYSVFGYFATKIKDICLRTRARSAGSNLSFRNYIMSFFRVLLEWAKAIVVVLCLREQGIQYDPKLKYSTITFVYYICTEKVFLEVLPILVELLKIEKLESLEHLFIPLFMNILAIILAAVVSGYAVILDYSNFILLSLYFTVYLRGKDAYYNYWKLILSEKEAYARFITATESDIRKWDDICAVCLNQMSRARITPCKHLFHPYCLKQCLKSSFNCPLCKHNFMDDVSEK